MSSVFSTPPWRSCATWPSSMPFRSLILYVIIRILPSPRPSRERCRPLGRSPGGAGGDHPRETPWVFGPVRVGDDRADSSAGGAGREVPVSWAVAVGRGAALPPPRIVDHLMESRG